MENSVLTVLKSREILYPRQHTHSQKEGDLRSLVEYESVYVSEEKVIHYKTARKLMHIFARFHILVVCYFMCVKLLA